MCMLRVSWSASRLTWSRWGLRVLTAGRERRTDQVWVKDAGGEVDMYARRDFRKPSNSRRRRQPTSIDA